jgi:hypothetical protein
MHLHEWVFKTADWGEQHGLDDGERGADSEVVDRPDAQ